MPRLLLIEQDEQTVVKTLNALVFERIKFDYVRTGAEGLQHIAENQYDVVFSADVLPDMVGESLLIELKSTAPGIPIILSSVSTETKRRVRYYRLGANDIIHKPYEPEELIARVWNLLRLTGKDEKVPLRVDGLRIDRTNRNATFEGEHVTLTQTEFDLLVYLAMNEGKALSREQILSAVWGYNFAGDTNLVDVYIRYLRLKIDKKYKKKLIRTVRGIGYMLDTEK